MRQRELGVAIVSSGRMGELRAHVAVNHPGVRFVACSDVDAARAERVGAQMHSGWCGSRTSVESRPASLRRTPHA
jgi:predicted dehydrogenase